MTLVRLTPADFGKPAVGRWLRDNGLDPRRVAALPGAEPVIRDGHIEATVYLLDPYGHRLIDHDGTPAYRVELIDVPLRVPLPPRVGRVLA